MSIHHRTKRVSGWLKELLEEQTPDGVPKNKAIAKRLVELALDPKLSSKDFLNVAEVILDRLEGKPPQMNINANTEIDNPFADVDTATLEQIRDQVKLIKGE